MSMTVHGIVIIAYLLKNEINASYGLGEAIVQGKVNPDEFYVYKPTLEKNKFAILQHKLGDKAVKIRSLN